MNLVLLVMNLVLFIPQRMDLWKLIYGNKSLIVRQDMRGLLVDINNLNHMTLV